MHCIEIIDFVDFCDFDSVHEMRHFDANDSLVMRSNTLSCNHHVGNMILSTTMVKLLIISIDLVSNERLASFHVKVTLDHGNGDCARSNPLTLWIENVNE